MNKLYLLLFAFCATVLFACSHSDNEEEQIKDNVSKGKVVGNWFSFSSDELLLLQFNSDGTGTVTTHKYDQIEWEISVVSLKYALRENVLTIKLQSSTIWSGTVNEAENKLSISMGVDMIRYGFTRFDGSEDKINELKKDIEENKYGPLPSEVTTVFMFTENDLLNFVNSIYYSLREYEYRQLNLEEIRLTGKNLRGIKKKITASSQEVKDVWNAAYNVILKANLAIQRLKDENSIKYITPEKCVSYRNELIALRDFVYYHVSQLWGSAIYINETDSGNKMIYSQSEMYNKVKNDLYAIHSILPITQTGEKEYRINLETVKAIQAEIALSEGKYAEALKLLENCDANLSLSINSNSYENSDMYNLLGEKIVNYSADVIALLTKEANLDQSTLVDDWKFFKIQWGYWGMLKRIGYAKMIAGCEDFELLMPIPQIILDEMPSMSQNPGY